MFVDRRSAGSTLAAHLTAQTQPVVLGIARGGVIVAEPIASRLSSPLDVLVIRKIGHPLQPELALGAASAGGDYVFTEYAAGFAERDLQTWVGATIQKAKDLESRLRGESGPVPLDGRVAIIVDDGIATSATMLCAIATARHRGAARVVAAVPVAPEEVVPQLEARCDALVTLQTVSHPHFAVGRFYLDFQEVSDQDVRDALERSREPH